MFYAFMCKWDLQLTVSSKNSPLKNAKTKFTIYDTGENVATQIIKQKGEY